MKTTHKPMTRILLRRFASLLVNTTKRPTDQQVKRYQAHKANAVKRGYIKHDEIKDGLTEAK